MWVFRFASLLYIPVWRLWLNPKNVILDERSKIRNPKIVTKTRDFASRRTPRFTGLGRDAGLRHTPFSKSHSLSADAARTMKKVLWRDITLEPGTRIGDKGWAERRRIAIAIRHRMPG
jgi:hypothetical protein